MRSFKTILSFLVIVIITFNSCRKDRIGADSTLDGDWVVFNTTLGVVLISIDAKKGSIEYKNETCGGGKECYINVSGHAIVQDDIIHMKNFFNKVTWDFYNEKHPEKFDTLNGKAYHWRMKFKEVVNSKSEGSGSYYGRLGETTFYKQ